MNALPDPGSGLVELPGDSPAARHLLPARTTTYWQLRAMLAAVVVVGLVTWGAAGLNWLTPAVRWAVVAVITGWMVGVGVLLRPPIRRSLFWYSLSNSEIDLQHGWIVQTRTVVPMNRVQHLKTEQGLLERRFALADLHIHTAAGAVVVKGLDAGEAAEVRVRIGLLAHLADDL